jgi:undecaprenyl diphosphate synthase
LFGRKKEQKINMDNLPVHVAVIPDGNGRWSKRRGLPKSIGHKEGADVIEKIVEHAGETGIKYITMYVFSTENWKREEKEVNYLMGLLKEFLDNSEKKIRGRDIKIKVIGSKEKLDKELIKSIENVEKKTSVNTGITLLLALNYGGRKEIIDCIKGIIKDNKKEEEITEELISDYLYTKNIPDPDLLIRTSGEMRSSNYLLWQMAYTEFCFVDKLWPDFTKNDFDKAIIEYQARQRRYGGRK